MESPASTTSGNDVDSVITYIRQKRPWPLYSYYVVILSLLYKETRRAVRLLPPFDELRKSFKNKRPHRIPDSSVVDPKLLAVSVSVKIIQCLAAPDPK